MTDTQGAQPGNLALPARLRQPFLRLIRGLPSELFAYRLRMGGGSILEARFAHRRSTDIDLHMSPADLNDLLKMSQDPWWFVLKSLPTAWNAAVWPSGRGLHGSVKGTPFSISQHIYLDMRSERRDSVEASPVLSESNAEILVGKLKRMMRGPGQRPNIAIRDLYDWAVCASTCPSDAQFALSRLNRQGRRHLAADLAAAPKDLHERDSQPVMMPTFDVQLVGLPQRMAEAVRTGDLAALPAACRPASHVPSNCEE